VTAIPSSLGKRPGARSTTTYGGALLVPRLAVVPSPIPVPEPLRSPPVMPAMIASDGSSSGHGASPLELLPPPALLLLVLVASGVVVERTRARRLLSYPRLTPPG